LRTRVKGTGARNDRGSAYGREGDQDRAIADCSGAIRLYPKYAVAFNNRGPAYHAKGDDDRAIADYNEAIRLAPKYENCRYAPHPHVAKLIPVPVPAGVR
jgi:tetratricopeptide (TPR) repeat protein